MHFGWQYIKIWNSEFQMKKQEVSVGSDAAPETLPFKNKRTNAMLESTDLGRQQHESGRSSGWKSNFCPVYSELNRLS